MEYAAIICSFDVPDVTCQAEAECFASKAQDVTQV